MANRTGLGGTTLQYLAVRKAMVSIHRPIHLKITLPYLLTWQTHRCTPWRMAFKVHQGNPFLGFIVCKNCQSGLLLQHNYVYC